VTALSLSSLVSSHRSDREAAKSSVSQRVAGYFLSVIHEYYERDDEILPIARYDTPEQLPNDTPKPIAGGLRSQDARSSPHRTAPRTSDASDNAALRKPQPTFTASE
jgi:hypothetical protein